MKEIDINVAVNFNTGYVIEKEGIEIDGVVYHTQYDLPGGKGQSIHIANSVFKKDTRVTRIKGGARVTVNWVTIINEEAVQMKSFKYRKEGSNEWHKVINFINSDVSNERSYFFDVNETGIYYIRAEDGMSNPIDDEIVTGDNYDRVSISLVNEPNNTDLKYMSWNSDRNEWDIIELNSNNLSDSLGKYYDYDYSAMHKKWINATDSEGNWWVWIPRFAYKIVEKERKNKLTGQVVSYDSIDENSEIVDAKRIEIKFLTDSSTVSDGYIVHPAFNDGKKGFWINKYQISEGGKSVPSANVIKSSINNITLPSNSHLPTPLEYGALLYLTYGSDQTIVGVNKYGISGGSNNVNDVYLNTVNMSTTKNCTGVYDLSSLNGDLVAGGVNVSNKIGNNDITVYTSSTNLCGDAIDDQTGGDGRLESFIRNYNLMNRAEPESGKYLVFGRKTELTSNMFNLNYDTEGSYRAVLN